MRFECELDSHFRGNDNTGSIGCTQPQSLTDKRSEDITQGFLRWPLVRASVQKRPFSKRLCESLLIVFVFYSFLTTSPLLFIFSSLPSPPRYLKLVHAQTKARNQMSAYILPLILAIAYGAYMYFFWRSARKNHASKESKEMNPVTGFEHESEIVHARLAHFPSQIGHWRISSMVKDHKQ